MPKKNAAAKKATPIKKAAKTKEKKASLPKGKDLKPARKKTANETAEVVTSEIVYEGPLFRVTKDHIIEPGGKDNTRDVIRHNGSIVVLAIDSSKDKKDPWIVMERQYRHAARQFLWELPAGKLEKGEDPLTGAKRELEEETGYRAKKWKEIAEYWASPGFLGESMQLFLAEGLTPGEASPEDDENIEMRLVKLSEAIKAVDKCQIQDAKTLIGVLLLARMLKHK